MEYPVNADIVNVDISDINLLSLVPADMVEYSSYYHTLTEYMLQVDS